MSLTWYGNQSAAEGLNFGPLALIFPLLERMKVAEIINRHVPADDQAEFDHGTVLSLLVAARLYNPVALTRVADWAAGRRNTDPESVTRRVGKLFGTKDAARYFRWEMQPLPKAQRACSPHPGRGCKRPTHCFSFTFDQTAVQYDEQYDGYSVLVATVPPQQGSADALFTKFKQQSYSEQVNGQFKGPLAVHPVFLHTPERVEALVFLMMITLQVYYLLQRLYRKSVPAKATAKERHTTTETILRAFHSYMLLIHHTRLGREVSCAAS